MGIPSENNALEKQEVQLPGSGGHTAKLRVASAISELGMVGKTSQEVERAAEGQSKKA